MKIIFYKNENNLLKEEIKELKEQLSEQVHNLVELDTLEKSIEKLKIENEELSKNNKEIKAELEKEKQLEKLKSNKSSFEINEKEKNVSAFRRVHTLSRKEISKSNSLEKDENSLQKQIDKLKKLREEEKKDYQSLIGKLKLDTKVMIVKLLNKQTESDNLLLKYKKIFKSISNQCKAKGIKLNISF